MTATTLAPSRSDEPGSWLVAAPVTRSAKWPSRPPWPSPDAPDDSGGVAHVDVDDVKAEAERLRGEDVNVGVVLELAGQMRLVDVYDPDGNRIQLAQPL